MNGRLKCNYLKAVRRRVAEANGLELEIPECTYEGDCSGTCPRCEGEIRQLEHALSLRRSLSQKVSVMGVAAGLAIAGMSSASAQSVVPQDCISTNQFEEEYVGQVGDEIIDPFMSTSAEFPGGNDSLHQYIIDNFHVPSTIRSGVQRVKILVGFWVEPTGEISHVEIIEGVNPLLDEEAKRVVSSMPKWKPATAYRKPVRSYYNLPIGFSLQE